MTEMQAALGLSQLKRLPAFLERRRSLARRYHEALAGTAFDGALGRPAWERGMAWHLYVVRFASRPMRRSAYEFLHSHGVRVQVHYRPLYRNPYYASRNASPLPGAEAYYEGCLSLPLYPGLEDDEQERVIEAVARFCAEWQRD